MVAIRHSPSSSTEARTTIILLCEDGSLKIYMACANATEFWLSPSVCHPMAALVNQAKPPRRAKAKSAKAIRASSSGTTTTFPIDFFEHCSLISNDNIEFGGSDVLQVYNVQQLKHR